MPFKVGIIGLIHHHLWWYVDGIKNVPDAEITCAADVNQEQRDRLEKMAGFNGGRLYMDYQAMLDREELDACLIYMENNRHAELTEICAARGLHVMVEKPIASTLDDADRMLAAVNKNGVRLMVNYPIFHMPFPKVCHEVIRQNRIGRIWLMRFGTGHSGPENFCSKYFLDWLMDPGKNGGGAMQDFGTYGAALFAWYFGQPDRVQAMAGKFVKSEYKGEDHAIITVKYEKARIIGTIEGTWCSIPDLLLFHLFGEKGAVFNSISDYNNFEIKHPEKDKIEKLPMPEPMGKWEDAVLPYFIGHIREKKPFEAMLDPQVARGAQEILDAAKLSIAEGREIQLPLN